MQEKLTVTAAAQLAGLSADSIRRFARLGKLPCEETPLGRLFRRSDVEQLMADRAAASK